MNKIYAVHLLASKRMGTLYIGVTGDLISRIQQHRDKSIRGFTAKYNVTRLVWYEWHSDVTKAIQREKTMKQWRRDWKINLIERDNPNWDDLFPGLMSVPSQERPLELAQHVECY